MTVTPSTGSRPVAAYRVLAAVADDRAQHDGDHDGVVGVPDDRDEVGHQIDAGQQVGEQDPQAEPHSSRQLRSAASRLMSLSRSGNSHGAPRSASRSNRLVATSSTAIRVSHTSTRPAAAPITMFQTTTRFPSQ
jgi:hypothetical protein